MNDNPTTTPTAFCQNCGKPLTPESARQVGASTYCEPCLEARLAQAQPGATTPPPPGYRPPYQPVNAMGGNPNLMPDGSLPPGSPSPALATVLGFIPGVGAMYNEQYAKGIVHLIVFVILVSLADNVNDVFGILIAGWIGYMAFDAFHTARARALGTPLPNPFGLNDIGERLGFSKTWISQSQTSPSQTSQSQTVPSQASPSQTVPTPNYRPPVAPFTAPASDLHDHAWQPAATPYVDPVQARADAFGNPIQTAPQPPCTAVPQAPPMATPVTPFVPAPSRFPSGAVWLIAIGCFFLLMTTGVFSYVHPEAIIGLGLIALAVYTFTRRMTDTGASLTDDGTPFYRYRLVRACRGSIWLAFIGLWLFLGSFDRFSLHRFWPILIILAGVLALLERVALNTAAPPPPQ